MLVSSGATLTLTGTAVLSLGGDYIMPGTLNENTSEIIFDGSRGSGHKCLGQGATKDSIIFTIYKSSGRQH